MMIKILIDNVMQRLEEIVEKVVIFISCFKQKEEKNNCYFILHML